MSATVRRSPVPRPVTLCNDRRKVDAYARLAHLTAITTPVLFVLPGPRREYGLHHALGAPQVPVQTLLPVPQPDLAAATELARQFITAYGSYRYDQPAEAYLARLRPITSDELYQRLARSAHNSAVLATRQREQTIVVANARVIRIHDLQANAIILLVSGHQQTLHANQ
ncbi:hypothetical protein [Actinomadura sp. 9N407]|uniref:hypothetical protein n=1 Tax=Actinomadura sp. 9N407 TaxID=3375154 RepID=UPI0037B19C52